MRLVDADIMRENLEWCKSQSGRYNDIYWDYVIERLDVQPTVDAAPVKHGRWEGNETCDAYDVVGVKTWAVKLKCSVCGFVHKFIEAHMCYEFCPNCGAKMDLEEQHDD